MRTGPVSPRWLGLVLLVQVPLLGHRPLVRDEVQTLEAARKSPGALWDALHHLDAPVGPYYALMHLWTQASESPAWLRLPSLLGLVGAVVLTVLTAERLAGRRAGLVTGLLLLANPATWVFGGIARPYGLALCAAAATLLIVLTRPRQVGPLLVVATVMLLLQGMFVLLVLAELTWLWWARERRAALALVGAVALWLPLGLVSTTQTVMTSWIPLTGPRPLLDYVAELFGSTGALAALALLTWGAFAVLGRRRDLLLLAAGPVVVLAAAGAFAHVLGGRYVLHAVLVVAVALGVASARVPRAALVVLVALALGNAVQWARTDWVQEDLPSAAAWLVAHDRPGDGLLYSPDHARAGFLPALEAADDGVARQDLAADVTVDRRRLGDFYLHDRPADEIRGELARRTRLWVVGYAGDSWRPTPNTGSDLVAGLDWQVVCTRSFGQLRVQLLVAPGTAPTDCVK